MQLNYHSPLHPAIPQSTYHPIFYRPKERATPSSPTGEAATDTEVVWEKRFIKCSYAMVGDSQCFACRADHPVLRSLLVLGTVLFLVDQTTHCPLFDHLPHRLLPRGGCIGRHFAGVPTSRSAMGPVAGRSSHRESVGWSTTRRFKVCHKAAQVV